LERRGVAVEPFVVIEDIDDPDVSVAFPEQDGDDLAVLMGAPWSIYEEVQGWVAPELEFVRRPLARGTPVLGICFGAHLMSAGLGGVVGSRLAARVWMGDHPVAETAIAAGPWFPGVQL
jgi:GMP synthase-like glutamine amidotransferase